jgi:flagellar motor switch protein FliN/FliY
MPAGPAAIRGLDWLLDEWATRFAAGFEAMAGEPLPHNPAPPSMIPSQALVWRQPFDIADGAAVEVAIPATGWRTVGKRILAAAGIDEAGDEDSKPTYFEVLQQSLSGLASALSAAVGREVGCGKGSEVHIPAAGAAMEFQIAGQPFVCSLSASPALLDALRPPAPPPASTTASTPAALELLYDVELPVSVSFGRAHLPVKEVLKLTSGSIVELNRGISEPVEVIVNNCVIARAEVVVIEGNYGVRILEIVSRSERLRTLH